MKPKLFTLARPTIAEGIDEFLVSNNLMWTTEGRSTDADKLVEFSGRICYMSFGAKQFRKNNDDYIANLISQGHESVLEHANWTFLLTDISRAFTHQLVRHRAGFSYSQLSQQYHDEQNADFIVPSEIAASPVAKAAWQRAIDAAREAYGTIKAELDKASPAFSHKENLRASRSAARSVLPNAIRTAIVVTANARSYRHFLNVRGAIEGDEEMREVASLIYTALKSDAPALVADFSLSTYDDGTPFVARTDSKK